MGLASPTQALHTGDASRVTPRCLGRAAHYWRPAALAHSETIQLMQALLSIVLLTPSLQHPPMPQAAARSPTDPTKPRGRAGERQSRARGWAHPAPPLAGRAPRRSSSPAAALSWRRRRGPAAPRLQNNIKTTQKLTKIILQVICVAWFCKRLTFAPGVCRQARGTRLRRQSGSAAGRQPDCIYARAARISPPVLPAPPASTSTHSLHAACLHWCGPTERCSRGRSRHTPAGHRRWGCAGAGPLRPLASRVPPLQRAEKVGVDLGGPRVSAVDGGSGVCSGREDGGCVHAGGG